MVSNPILPLVAIVRPEWIAADSSRMRRKVVVDGRRILHRDVNSIVDLNGRA